MTPKALCAIIAPLAAITGYVLWPRAVANSGGSAPVQPSAAAPATPKVSRPALAFKTGASASGLPAASAGEIQICPLGAALEQGLVKAGFSGNGRDRLRASLTGVAASALRVEIPAGQAFTASSGQIIVVRPTVIDLAPGGTGEALLSTFATSSTHVPTESAYTWIEAKNPRFQPLLDYCANHLELPLPAIQTMALVIAENLPLSAVMKFTPATEESRSRFNTDAFRVETVEIITALSALREMGFADESVAMTIDPQLKIEAMIEPLSKAAAMRYYGISADKEWDYWKNELLNGAPATRHYALYGIARFYPDVALEMLPRWVREPRTNPVYRLSALQALADTGRPEALPVLRSLVQELGAGTELGRAALGAAGFLDQRLKSRAGRSKAVAFRAAETQPQPDSPPAL